MRKLFYLVLCLLSADVYAQGILSRVTDPNAERTVFVQKGSRAFGIAGSYWNFDAGGDVVGDGYAVMSLLNIGSGKYATYNVSPKFSFFVADDLALGFRLDYSGYKLNTDLRLDLRNAVDMKEIAGDDPKLMEELNDLLNLRVSNRSMYRNTWGASVTLRKFIPFFGSQTFAVFAEARLYGNYGRLVSTPIDYNGAPVQSMLRTSNVFSTGLKFAGGLCIRLKGNNSIAFSVPLLGFDYSYTRQHKAETNNNAHLSQFKVARNLDMLGLQVGYFHFVQGKKKK